MGTWRKWGWINIFGQLFLTKLGVKGWEWAHQRGHKGLQSHPGCKCSHGHWVVETDEEEARTLRVKQKQRDELLRMGKDFWWSIVFKNLAFLKGRQRPRPHNVVSEWNRSFSAAVQPFIYRTPALVLSETEGCWIQVTEWRLSGALHRWPDTFKISYLPPTFLGTCSLQHDYAAHMTVDVKII